MSNFFMAIDLFVKLMKGDNGEAQYDFRLGFLFKHVNMPNPICGSSPGTPRMATWTRHVTYHFLPLSPRHINDFHVQF